MRSRTLGPSTFRPAFPRPAASPWLRLALVGGLAVAAWGIAGSSPASAGEPERSPRELVYAYKVWKLTDLLDLSDEQMPAFFAKMKKIDELEVEVSDAERAAARDLGRLLERGEVGDEELARALRAYEDMRSRRSDELQAARRDALSVLSVRQRCSYVVFEDRFRDEMRQMIGRAKELRRGDGAGAGGEDRGRDDQSGESDRGRGNSGEESGEGSGGGSGGGQGSGGGRGSGSGGR